jgi:hypothetical protein
MTHDEVINIAETKAQELNIPWSRDALRVQRRRFWPFPAFWLVEARVKSQGAITTIKIADRTGFAIPRDVRYPAGGLV